MRDQELRRLVCEWAATGAGWALALAALWLMAGCGSQGARGATTPEVTAVDTLRAVAHPTDPTPSAEDATREALLGVTDVAESHLSARMALRPLRMPHPGRGASARFDLEGGHRAWITAMPNAELLTSPAFADGKLFLGGGFASHQFYALNAYSGELEWAVNAPDGGPTAAIVLGKRVLFNTESCTLFVVDADTGALRWKRWLGDPLMSQPAASGELVFSAYPAGGGHVFGAFRLSDGEPVWTQPIPADVIQAPQVQGDAVYFATMDGSVFRLSAQTGAIAFQRDVGAASPLWVDRDRVLLTRRVDDSGVFEQPVVLDAATGRTVREGERLPAPYLAGGSRDRTLSQGQQGAWGSVPHGDHLGLGNVAAGWAFQGSSAAVADGRAYFAVGGELRAREVATGRDVWTRSYAEAQGAQAVSPPAVVGSQVIFGTVDGHLYATDIDTGMTLWAYDVGEPIVFQPVVAQGWVYVATARGNLIGLELGDPQLDGWHMWGGNPQHAGLVETAGTVDPALLASLGRPSRGSMHVAAFEEVPAPEGTPAAEPATASDAPDGVIRPAPRDEPELPLRGTHVEGTISGFVARMTITQVFTNSFDRPIEAVYLFPLPDAAAVDAMEFRVGNRVVRGQIKERQQARATYEAARTEGHRAALLEQQRPELFAQRVANIQPGETIEVRIAYVQPLRFEDGQYELVFPMASPRRFDPARPAGPAHDATRAQNVASVSAASANPLERPPVTIALDVDAGLPLGDVASPTHTIDVQRTGAQAARVVLGASDGAPDHDFVLRYGVSGAVPRVAVLSHREADEGWFSLVVQPPAVPTDAMTAPRDVTFVIDTSSSMRGRPMDQARAAVRAVLQTLRGSDTFEVLAFAEGVQRTGRVTRSEAELQRATTFVDELRAVGATQMMPAIEAALDREAHAPERVQLVVLVTDGYVANEAQVLRTVASHLGATRVFALGVGTAPNRFLLDRLAQLGRGRAEFVAASEDAALAGQAFAAQIDRPVLTDVVLDFGGLEVADVYPRLVPDLFAGRPLVVNGRFAHGGRGRVRVEGTFAGRRVEQVVDVVLPDGPGDAHDAQRVLWARAAIRDRLERLTFREDPALVAEVTALGLAHAIVTPYTSFVAVDVQDSPPDAESASTPTLSPARSLPGDPEIRIPAPRDARAVTLVLPFGETLAAAWEPELGLWSARFLIPRDAEEGQYPVYVLITLADGSESRLVLWYTVDQSAPLVTVEFIGPAHAGDDVLVRATQVLTRADLSQVGMRPRDPRLTLERAQILSDARRVEVSLGGVVTELELAAPGVWEARVHVPEDAAPGPLGLDVFAVDLAANVRTQRAQLLVLP